MTTLLRIILISLFALSAGYSYGQVSQPEVEIVSVVQVETDSSTPIAEIFRTDCRVKYISYSHLIPPSFPPVDRAQELLQVTTRTWFQPSPRRAAHRGSTREAHSTL